MEGDKAGILISIHFYNSVTDVEFDIGVKSGQFQQSFLKPFGLRFKKSCFYFVMPVKINPSCHCGFLLMGQSFLGLFHLNSIQLIIFKKSRTDKQPTT